MIAVPRALATNPVHADDCIGMMENKALVIW